MISYESYVNDCTDTLSQRLSEFARAGLPIDIGYWLQCYAFDTVGMMTFGSRFGFLDHGEDVNNLIQSIETGATISTTVGVYPALHPLVFNLRLFLNCNKKVQGGGFLSLFSMERVQAFKKQQWVAQEPESFIAKFLRLQEERPESMTDRAIILGTVANIAAGSDITSITLSSIIYHLCKNPKVLEKLRAEIDQSAESELISDPITFREAQSLPYLQAVIKEGLRIHPATGLTMPRLVPSGGRMIAGHWFPEGATVGINSWVAHHNTDIYGQDADQFRPERWLDHKGNKDLDAYFSLLVKVLELA